RPSEAPNRTESKASSAISTRPFLDVGKRSWRSSPRTTLTPSENINVTFTAIVNANATVGDPIWVNATVVYEDISNRSIGPKFDQLIFTVQAPPPLRTDLTSVLAVLAFALLALLAATL